MRNQVMSLFILTQKYSRVGIVKTIGIFTTQFKTLNLSLDQHSVLVGEEMVNNYSPC